MDKLLYIALIALTVLNIHASYTLLSGKPIDVNDTKQCAEKMLDEAIGANNVSIRAAASTYGMGNGSFIEKWTNIRKCISKSKVYMNEYQSNETAGYIVQSFSNTIWVNKNTWSSYTLGERVRILIHECSHLAAATKDIYYIGQDEFPKLRGARALQNADTVTVMIFEVARWRC